MKELTFTEKLLVLYENLLDHPFFIILFFVPIILFFLQKKHGKKIFIIAYILVVSALLITFGDILFKLFDNLMDGLFMVLYFPNFITLFGVVVACSLITLVTIFQNARKTSKVINYVSFVIIQILFSLILISVRVNKINIYKENSLYKNEEILTLMQLLIGTFAIQILSLIIIKIIDKATQSLNNKASHSKEVNKQIEKLTETKIKPATIDNNKIGFINVADKSVTSKPILKPFKFDIRKIESISFSEYLFPPKPYQEYKLDNKNVSYYNEIIPKKLFNKVNLDYNKYLNLYVYSPYKPFKLENKDVYYLNEIIKKKKFKILSLDSSKFAYLKTNSRLFRRVILENKNVSYLHEIIKVRKIKPIIIDSNKIISLNVPNKSFKILSLDDKSFSYLTETPSKGYKKADLNIYKASNIIIEIPKKDYSYINLDSSKDIHLKVKEKPYKNTNLDLNKTTNITLDVPKKDYSYIDLDSSKDINLKVKEKPYKNTNLDLNKTTNITLDVPKKDYSYIDLDSSKDINLKVKEKPYNKISLKNKVFKYLNEIINNQPKENNYKNNNSLKPLENTKDSNTPVPQIKETKLVTPIMTFPNNKANKYKMIDNLKIIDIQSTLDIAVKFHLMKNINLKTYEKLTVNNLRICNFKLLSETLKLYTVHKVLKWDKDE